MTSSRLIPGFVLVLVLGSFAVAPTATAQDEPSGAERRLAIGLDTGQGKGLKLVLPPGKNRLMPELDQARVVADFVVTIPQGACVGGQILVRYDLVKVPRGVIATMSPDTQVQPYSGDETAADLPSYAATSAKAVGGWHTEVLLMFDRSVPAFTDQPITISAKAFGGEGQSSGCNAVDSEATEVTMPVRADYLANMQYVPEAILLTSGQNKKVAFPLTVTNFGNGPTRVVTSVEALTDGLETIQPPGEFLVDSKATSGESAPNQLQTAITVLTSTDTGYTNKVHAFKATFRARSDTTGHDLMTQEITIPFSIKVQGVYVPGPGSAPAMGAAGLALLAFSLGRRPRTG